MKKMAIALLTTTLFTSAACGASGDVVATYSGGKVTSEQVMQQFKPMLDAQAENKDKKFSELDKKMQEMLVKGYVNQKLLEQEAAKMGIPSEEAVKTKIKNAEMQIIQKELINRKIEALVTEKEIDAEYQKLLDRFNGQDQIEVSHILVATEAEAKDVKSKLEKGAKFEDLAKELSKDTESKNKGGKIGIIAKGESIPEFENAAFAMSKGQVSSPVQTNFGWHIIKILDRKPIKLPAKSEMLDLLKSNASNRVIEKYLEDLSKTAKVELKLPQ